MGLTALLPECSWAPYANVLALWAPANFPLYISVLSHIHPPEGDCLSLSFSLLSPSPTNFSHLLEISPASPRPPLVRSVSFSPFRVLHIHPLLSRCGRAPQQDPCFLRDWREELQVLLFFGTSLGCTIQSQDPGFIPSLTFLNHRKRGLTFLFLTLGGALTAGLSMAPLFFHLFIYFLFYSPTSTPISLPSKDSILINSIYSFWFVYILIKISIVTFCAYLFIT